MVRKRHKVNYLNGFDKKRVTSQYATKYVTLLSSSPQPATAQRASAGLFWYAADESLLADDVYQNSPNDRQVVGCCEVARFPPQRCRRAPGPTESRQYQELAISGLREKQYLCSDEHRCHFDRPSDSLCRYDGAGCGDGMS